MKDKIVEKLIAAETRRQKETLDLIPYIAGREFGKETF